MHIDICVELTPDAMTWDRLAKLVADFERNLQTEGGGDKTQLVSYEVNVTGDLEDGQRFMAKLLELQET